MMPLGEAIIKTLHVVGLILIPAAIIAASAMLTMAFLGWLWTLLFEQHKV